MRDNIVTGICIFAITLACCLIVSLSLKGMYGDEINISFVKDIFSIGATVFTGAIAIYLFNGWKEQHKATIHKEQIYKALENLSALLTNLYQVRNIINKIEKIISSKSYIYEPNLIKIKSKKLDDLLFDIHTHINNYQILKKTNKLDTYYFDFEKLYLQIPLILDTLIDKYKNYCNVLQDNINEINLNKENVFQIEKKISGLNYEKIMSEEGSLVSYLKLGKNFYIVDKETGKKEVINKLTPYQFLNETIDKCEKLKVKCLAELDI